MYYIPFWVRLIHEGTQRPWLNYFLGTADQIAQLQATTEL
jgi:hypothetical protein